MLWETWHMWKLEALARRSTSDTPEMSQANESSHKNGGKRDTYCWWFRNPKANHRLDGGKNVQIVGFSTNLNWWVSRISEPSTDMDGVSKLFVAHFTPLKLWNLIAQNDAILEAGELGIHDGFRVFSRFGAGGRLV